MTEPSAREAGRDAERLHLARVALVQTGYFTDDEVGDDVAPRVGEMWSMLRSRIELSTAMLRALAVGPVTADLRVRALDAATENERRLAGGGSRGMSEKDMALVEGPEIEQTVLVHPRDDGPKGYYGPPVELAFMSDGTVRWRYDQ